MKTRLLQSAAAAALAVGVPGAAFAQSQPSGYVMLRGGTTNIDVGGFDDNATTLGADGAWVIPTSDWYSAQFNLSYSNVDANGNDIDIWRGDASFFGRVSDQYAAGGFLTAAEFDSANVFGGGVDGSLYRGNTTWSGQAGYFDIEGDTSLWAIAGQALFFTTEFLSLGGHAAFGNFDASGIDTDAWNIGADVEYQFQASPFSIGAEVDYATFDDFNIDLTTFRVSGTYNFNTGDLLTRNRTGASQSGSRNLMRLIPF